MLTAVGRQCVKYVGWKIKLQQIATKLHGITFEKSVFSQILKSQSKFETDFYYIFKIQNPGIHSIHTKLSTDCISVKPQLHENNLHSCRP